MPRAIASPRPRPGLTLVAPVAGTFRAPDGHPAATGPGTDIGDRTDLGHVEARGGSNAVTAAFPATVIEWLVEDGDPVSAGQPLLRLQPVQAAAAPAGPAQSTSTGGS